ncbi:MAG: ABC transporter permease [Patescibacteria group bacterium]
MKALLSLRRNPYQSLSIFFALTFSFFMLLLFSFTILLLTKLVSYIETQPQVTVYFLKTTPESQIFKFREELLTQGKVKEARYISKEEALKIYKDLNKNEPLLLEMVTKDALPASLEVFTKQPEFLSEVAQEAKKVPGVEDVSFQQDIIDSLIRVTNTIKWSAIAFLTAQFLIVFFVIFATITFKIMSRKEEIEILRLLGASRYFVIRPFLAENLLINFAASITSSTVFMSLFFGFQSQLSAFLVGIPALSLYNQGTFAITIWPPNAYVFILLASISFIVGYIIIWLTTFVAASKYVK